jgi:glycosyltransferase involved in cell wall biosynthesis
VRDNITGLEGTLELDSKSATCAGAPLAAMDALGVKGRHIVLLGNNARQLLNFRGPLLGAMAARGHRVTAIAPETTDSIRVRLSAVGVGLRDVPMDPTGLNPLRDVTTLRALRRLFADLRPDVILTYTIKPVLYGSLVARLTGVPERFCIMAGVSYAFGGTGAKARSVRAVTTPLYRAALACNRLVFFQNPDDLALFERLRLLSGRDKAVLINGSGVDVDHFEHAPLPSEPRFLLVARMVRAKGIVEYVEAARILKRRHPNVPFRLVGWFYHSPGHIARATLEAWVQEGVIEYLGDLEDVRPALRDAAVFVLPSYYPEGQPRSILEALAMGRPVVTTDTPGCREAVRDGVNGFLVPPRDPEALAAAMERLIMRPELIPRMGLESRRAAEEKYDVHKVNAVILEAMGL